MKRPNFYSMDDFSAMALIVCCFAVAIALLSGHLWFALWFFIFGLVLGA